jgi:hypothetical protein
MDTQLPPYIAAAPRVFSFFSREGGGGENDEIRIPESEGMTKSE